jgi:hypothetical protein
MFHQESSPLTTIGPLERGRNKAALTIARETVEQVILVGRFLGEVASFQIAMSVVG